MRLRSLLRAALLALGLAVTAVVVWQWRPEGQRTASDGGVPQLTLPEVSAERPAESVTRALDVLVSANGRRVYRVYAAEHVDFVDGWNEWSGPPLGLVVFGREGESDVRVSAERMRTTGNVDNPDEVRMIGDVVAELGGGGRFTAQRVDFDAVDGLVHTCRRSELVYAGIRIRSDCLEFRTAGSVSHGDVLVPETLRMYGNLKLASAAATSSLPEGLDGAAEELLFRPGGETVTLRGTPRLNFGDVQVRGDRLSLDVDLEADQLRGVVAEGGGRLRLRPGGAAPQPRADGAAEAAEEQGATGSLQGDRLEIAFAPDATLSDVVASSVGTEGARFVLRDRGALVAERILLRPQEGSALQIQGLGGVLWEAEGAEESLGALRAAEVVLETGEDGSLESLVADGEVRATLGEGGTRRRFTGGRLELGWRGSALLSGSWPEGMALETADGRATAGAATYDAATRRWRLSGPPAPHFVGAGVQLEAQRIEVATDGEVVAEDAVRVGLSADRLQVAAALFGDAEAVDVRATAAHLSPAGNLLLEGPVEATWGDRTLFARSLRLDSDPGRLRATGDVELVVPDEEGAAEPTARGYVTLATDALLVEQADASLRTAGNSLLRRGERDIRAQRLAVRVDPAGGWRQLEAEGDVQLRDPQARGEGRALRYDFDSGEIVLFGSEEAPARFEYEDLSYSSTETLRVLFEPEQLVIETSENGRTRTRPVRRSQK